MDRAVAQHQGARGHPIEQGPVMAHQDEGRGKLVAHPGFEMQDLGQVQMVGRLVQQQEVRLARRRPGDEGEATPAAAELAESCSALLLAEAEGGQQRLGPIAVDRLIRGRHSAHHDLAGR